MARRSASRWPCSSRRRRGRLRGGRSTPTRTSDLDRRATAPRAHRSPTADRRRRPGAGPVDLAALDVEAELHREDRPTRLPTARARGRHELAHAAAPSSASTWPAGATSRRLDDRRSSRPLIRRSPTASDVLRNRWRPRICERPGRGPRSRASPVGPRGSPARRIVRARAPGARPDCGRTPTCGAGSSGRSRGWPTPTSAAGRRRAPPSPPSLARARSLDVRRGAQRHRRTTLRVALAERDAADAAAALPRDRDRARPAHAVVHPARLARSDRAGHRRHRPSPARAGQGDAARRPASTTSSPTAAWSTPDPS